MIASRKIQGTTLALQIHGSAQLVPWNFRVRTESDHMSLRDDKFRCCAKYHSYSSIVRPPVFRHFEGF